MVTGLAQIAPSPQPPHSTNIDAHLLLRDLPRETVSVGKGFKIAFTLVVSSLLPSDKQGQRLQLSLVIQHLSPLPASVLEITKSALPESSSFSPRALSSPGFSSPSPTYSTFNYPLAHQKLLAASQEQSVATRESDAATSSLDNITSLPPPFFEKLDESKRQRMSAVAFSGPSAIALPTIELQVPSSSKSKTEVDKSSSDDQTAASWPSAKHQATLDFELEYVALQWGFATVGGLRLLLVGEKFVGDGEEDVLSVAVRPVEVRTLKEWNVLSEVWVS